MIKKALNYSQNYCTTMTIRTFKKIIFLLLFMQSIFQFAAAQSNHKDLPFLQEYSEKYNFEKRMLN